jgi:hypothetical protein
MNHHLYEAKRRVVMSGRRRRFTTMLQLTLVIALLAAAPAFAAKGGNGKASTQPTLTVTQSAEVAAFSDGQSLTVAGTDYGRSASVFVVFGHELPSQLIQADRSGSFSFTWTPPAAGTYTLESYEKSKNKGWQFGARTTVTVVD